MVILDPDPPQDIPADAVSVPVVVDTLAIRVDVLPLVKVIKPPTLRVPAPAASSLVTAADTVLIVAVPVTVNTMPLLTVIEEAADPVVKLIDATVTVAFPVIAIAASAIVTVSVLPD
jgi:hypothetical protein